LWALVFLKKCSVLERPKDEVTGILRDKKDFDFFELTILFISQTSDSSPSILNSHKIIKHIWPSLVRDSF
jgi:hypothetical protein